MKISDEQRRLLTLCAIRVDGQSLDWSLIGREASRPSGLDNLQSGHISERSTAASEGRPILRRGLGGLDDAADRVAAELEAAGAHDARLVTVFDETYPANLRLIWNLPPFLFIRGDDTRPEDLRSVAVVGTRDATPRGLTIAREMAERLTDRDVTVVSGLARGIDTAAHRAAIDAGGRTLAVIGTGITKTYPAENEDLANEITQHGAIVSQFWPTAGPARWTFPRRNVVMSGIAQGTVVVEASSTSGAKMQARLATEHGKRVFLMETLVTDQPWAQRYIAQNKAIEVHSVDDVVRHLASPQRIEQVTTERQLSLDLVK